MKHSLVPCFVVAMLVGCGGSDDGSTPSGTGATCSQTNPCGGDITGDWSIVSFCPDKSNAAPEEVKQICDDATVEFDTPMVSGTVSFGTDMSFTQMASASGTGYLVFPASCLNQGTKLTCAQVQDALTSNAKDQKWSCASANNGCRCGLQLANSANVKGTFTTSGNNLTLKSTGSDDLASMYCVQASDKLFMHLSLATSATAGDKPYQVAGQLELEKK